MTVGLVHSTRLALPWIEEALAPFASRAKFLHALDEALIVELAKGRGVTEGASRRITLMAESLIEAGAERVVMTCSSLSPAVDAVAPLLSAPLVKVDQAMVRAAVSAGRGFAILATNPSTRAPMRIIVEAAEARLGSRARWRYELVEGAFDALNRGEPMAHDAAVAEACERLAAGGDAVLFAQVSMARALPRLSPSARGAARTSLDYLEETIFGES